MTQEERSISNFALADENLYFGAGHRIYRLNLASRSVEVVYTGAQERSRPMQPFIDGELGYSSDQNLFITIHPSSGQLLQTRAGYGAYGAVEPMVIGDRVLACTREEIHYLDRVSGKLLWKRKNWFGRASDGVEQPYVYKDSVYYKISEEYFTKSDENDGHWAEISLRSGERVSIIPAVHNATSGAGFGSLDDGVIYGATRRDYFGAVDLESKRLRWEVKGINKSRPGVNNSLVFTTVGDDLQALDKKTGAVIWSESLGEIIQRVSPERGYGWKWDYENLWSRRIAATDDIVIVQGSQGISAREAQTGKLLWSIKTEGIEGTYFNNFQPDADPIIVRQVVIASSAKGCAVFALDLKTGREMWRAHVPDCSYTSVIED